MIVSTVDTTACHSVNHTTSHVTSSPSVSVRAARLRPRASTVANGHA